MGKSYPQKIKDWCREQYAAGARLNDLAAETGAPRTTISYWVQPHTKAAVLENSKRRYAEKKPEILRKNKKWRKDNPLRDACMRAKNRARKRDPECDLTTDYLESIFPEDGLCPALKKPLVIQPGTPGMSQFSVSLDKIDPLGGYRKGNVQFLSARANAVKHNASADEVLAVANFMLAKLDSTDSTG